MPKRLVLACVASMLLQSTAHAASYVFSAPVHVRSGTGFQVAVGDFNDDDRDDLAVLVKGAVNVSLQRTDGTLAPAIEFDIPGVRSVHAMDLQGDGKGDLVVGHDQGLAVYTWDGTALVPHEYAADIACFNLASGDVDGDGAPDVYCTNGEADAVLFHSDAATVLGERAYMRTSGQWTGQALLEDVTGDGKRDLLVVGGSSSFFVYPHDGDRGFLPAVAYPYVNEDSPWAEAIAVTDFDGDGSNDVVVVSPGNKPRSALHVFRLGAGGYLKLWKTIPSLDSPSALLDVDVDGDGDDDLMVGHAGWDTVGRHMRGGQALSPVELWASVPTTGGAHQLAWGDLNHDGDPDLAVGNSFGASVLYGGRQAASDFNKDFVSDVVWRRQATGETKLWKSADNKQAGQIETKDSTWYLQATGDFNADGTADTFWRNSRTGANDIHASGTGVVAPTTGVPSQDWQVVGAGDFDADGASDLLWRNHRTGANAIWKSGYSATPQAVATTGTAWKVAAVGDFDGDLLSDILWRHASTGQNVIWRSARSDASKTIATATQPWTVGGVGDFNGDGKEDVLWRHPATGANVIWSSADPATPVAVSAVADAAWAVGAVGDYNGDGRADVMWRNAKTGANIIWRSADSRTPQAVSPVAGWTVVP